MSKRPFQIMDEMNIHDSENGTKSIGVCTDIIELKTVTGGATVTIGIPGELMQELMRGERMAFLVLPIKDDYINRKG